MAIFTQTLKQAYIQEFDAFIFVADMMNMKIVRRTTLFTFITGVPFYFAGNNVPKWTLKVFAIKRTIMFLNLFVFNISRI